MGYGPKGIKMLISTLNQSSSVKMDLEYALSGDNWGNLPEGWVYKEGTSVGIDSNDQVYVFYRGLDR